MELVLVGAAFIICGILLLFNIGRKRKSGEGNTYMRVRNRSGLGRFIERIEKLKINRRNYLEPEQLSANQKLLLERTNRWIKRFIAYILITIGLVFLIC